MLDEVRPGIDAYEWFAASSHSHEPQRGIVKYRIVMLPDRDILPEERRPLLEALDERLEAALLIAARGSDRSLLPAFCPQRMRATRSLNTMKARRCR